MVKLQRAIELQPKVQVLSKTELERAVAANTAEIKKFQAAVEGWALLRVSFRDDGSIIAANLGQSFGNASRNGENIEYPY